MASPTKPQRLLLLGNGFLAALAELGVDTLDSSNMGFEFPFMHGWRRWGYISNPNMPTIEYGTTCQPRDILHRVASSNSPFKYFESEGISVAPRGWSPRGFLETYCDELPVYAWLELGELFLVGQQEYSSSESAN